MTAARVQSFKSLSIYLALLWLIMCFGVFCPFRLRPLTIQYVLEVRLTSFAISSTFLNRIQFCFLRQILEYFLPSMALDCLCLLFYYFPALPVCFTLDIVNLDWLWEMLSYDSLFWKTKYRKSYHWKCDRGLEM